MEMFWRCDRGRGRGVRVRGKRTRTKDRNGSLLRHERKKWNGTHLVPEQNVVFWFAQVQANCALSVGWIPRRQNNREHARTNTNVEDAGARARPPTICFGISHNKIRQRDVTLDARLGRSLTVSRSVQFWQIRSLSSCHYGLFFFAKTRAQIVACFRFVFVCFVLGLALTLTHKLRFFDSTRRGSRPRTTIYPVRVAHKLFTRTRSIRHAPSLCRRVPDLPRPSARISPSPSKTRTCAFNNCACSGPSAFFPPCKTATNRHLVLTSLHSSLFTFLFTFLIERATLGDFDSQFLAGEKIAISIAKSFADVNKVGFRSDIWWRDFEFGDLRMREQVWSEN